MRRVFLAEESKDKLRGWFNIAFSQVEGLGLDTLEPLAPSEWGLERVEAGDYEPYGNTRSLADLENNLCGHEILAVVNDNGRLLYKLI